MTLATYRKKRRFAKTPEPAGDDEHGDGASFCVQKHDATRLHYDFRLEVDGVLKSWAVPKGPSLDPKDKRLAVEVEDHPLAYGGFEGVIPEGEYGAGPVLLWDRGTWHPVGDAADGLARGKLDFELAGEKLHGRFHLVRTRAKESDRPRAPPSWLLIKSNDAFAHAGDDVAHLGERSVKSGRTIEAIHASSSPTSSSSHTSSSVPAFVAPELCTAADEPPRGEAWVHEEKIDGYRLLARKKGARVQLFTRNGLDWTAKFPSVASAVAKLAPTNVLIDGEVAAVNGQFGRLQRALAGEKTPLRFFAFDCLYLEDTDLRALPLVERKRVLAGVLARHKTIAYLAHHRGDGAAFLDKVVRAGGEGIVSKRADAPYRSERSRDWVKVRRAAHEEHVVVGFTKSGHGVSALLLADGDAYRGKVGTGFTQADRAALARMLAPLTRKTPPVKARVRGATWVEPRVVVEVKHSEVTDDGKLRHPVFLGVREDKAAPTTERDDGDGRTHRRAAVAHHDHDDAGVVAGVRVTHPERAVYEGITKLDVARYVEAIAPLMLPHVAGRPLAVLRCPDGVAGSRFFQKHAMRGMPAPIDTVDVVESDGAHASYLSVHDAAGLVGLVQMGVLELHPWGGTPESADRVIFDLDPDVGLPWSRVVDAARALRARIEAEHLRAFVKTTGGKGLHVVVPRSSTWDDAKTWAHDVAVELADAAPDLYTANMKKSARAGRLFIDYLRNSRGATAVAPYSMRARPGAPVAVPVEWDEIDDVKSDAFTILTLHERVARAVDPWRAFPEVTTEVTTALTTEATPAPRRVRRTRA